MAQRPFFRSRTRTVLPGDPVQHETTDVEDVQLLAADIVALIQQNLYDDMTWAEVDNALMLASHTIKTYWSATGTVKPAEAA
jgi:hypothetical protein